MFSGEAEVLVRRKTLAIIQDEVKLVVEAARGLPIIYSALLSNESETLKTTLRRIENIEIEAATLRRILTRELAEIGTMIMSREDVLRVAFGIEKVVQHINGAGFRASQIDSTVLQDHNLSDEIKELIEMAVEIVQRLGEVVRSLIINPTQSIELATNVERLEGQIDGKYRALIIRVLNEVNSIKEAIILTDMIESLENMSDECLGASDSITILSLSL